MRQILICAAAAAMIFSQAACATPGLGLPPSAVATADNVSISAENALTAANLAEDTFVLRVEAHVQAGDIHGADAERLRQLIMTISSALNAADAAYRLGNNALVSVKTGDALRLITGAMHDFPALANTIPH